jgi:hypothetical protein
MTITLLLQKETFLRDLQTLLTIFKYKDNIEAIEKIKAYYEPLNISSSEWNPQNNISIQVTPEEFLLIGIFNNGLF